MKAMGFMKHFLNALFSHLLNLYTNGGEPTRVMELDPRPKWLCICEKSTEDLTVKEISTVLGAISRLLIDGKFAEVNAAIAISRPEMMSIDGMVAMLRSTYAARDQLPSWQDALERALLVTRNRDDYDSFRGFVGGLERHPSR